MYSLNYSRHQMEDFFVCDQPLCGKIFQTQNGLRRHSIISHKGKFFTVHILSLKLIILMENTEYMVNMVSIYSEDVTVICR